MCTGYSTFTGLKEKLGFQQEQEGCEKSEATLLTGAVPAPAIMATPPPAPRCGLPQGAECRSHWEEQDGVGAGTLPTGENSFP